MAVPRTTDHGGHNSGMGGEIAIAKARGKIPASEIYIGRIRAVLFDGNGQSVPIDRRGAPVRRIDHIGAGIEPIDHLFFSGDTGLIGE